MRRHRRTTRTKSQRAKSQRAKCRELTAELIGHHIKQQSTTDKQSTRFKLVDLGAVGRTRSAPTLEDAVVLHLGCYP